MNRRPIALLNPDASGLLNRPLQEQGFSVIEMPLLPQLDRRTAGHPDLQMFILGKTAFIAPGAPDTFQKALSAHIDVIRCSREISQSYPGDCIYNIACTGKYAFCKKGNIPLEIENALHAQGIVSVHSAQGYARCSIIPVSEDCIITEDAGIDAAARRAGLDSLLIRPGYIPLAGFPRGFIGGACGVCRETVYISGTLDAHPDAEMMYKKISEAGKKVVELSSLDAEDFGSILFIE